MGDRAVITTEDRKIGIYVHWNGDRESVESFLKECKEKNYRRPEDDNYGWVCLVGVIFNFFDKTGLSCGIDLFENLDTTNVDNGVYIIKNWEIIDNFFVEREK